MLARTPSSPRTVFYLTIGVAAAAISLSATARAGPGYQFTLNPTTSTLAYSFTSSAPFTGAMMGENNVTRPATEQTRTKRLASPFSSCGSLTAAQNDSITISGSISSNGSSPSPSNVHPSGAFRLGLNPGAGTCALEGFNVNLVGAGSIAAAANLSNFTYQSFCAINPSCTAPYFIPITLPLGNVTVTSLVAAQASGAQDGGTLTATSTPGAYTFSVNTTLTITPAVSFSGNAIAADPQTVPATVSGSVTVSGNTATIAATTQITYHPATNTTPSAQPATALTVPSDSSLCPNVNLLLTLTITSSSVNSMNTASINAAGTRLQCAPDYNLDGVLSTQDIFDFLNGWFAGDARANFNHVNGLDVQDIFDFLNSWLSNPVGC